MDPTRIRRATIADAETLYDISRSVHLGELYRRLIPDEHYARFRADYTPSNVKRNRYSTRLSRHLADPAWCYWVAEQSGAITGFIATVDIDRTRHLQGLFVRSEHQGQGIGRRLLLNALAVPGCDKFYLEVLTSNQAAIKLYQTAGFETDTVSISRVFYGARLTAMAIH
ncbi:MAG TPA: GNAT family N-acetyltransferase [Candidatus Saccharimonadales bacterium]|jgi:ribosomal protein S18 acetylase RimI-like enzyme